MIFGNLINGNKNMKYLILLFTLLSTGCTVLQESRWESSVQTSTRVYTDKPQVVDHVDFCATLKRSW